MSKPAVLKPISCYDSFKMRDELKLEHLSHFLFIRFLDLYCVAMMVFLERLSKNAVSPLSVMSLTLE